MRHLIGLLLLAVGVALIRVAITRRDRILAQERALAAAGLPDPRAGLHPSLAAIGDIVPPLMIGGVGVIAFKLVLAYVMTGAERWFSLIDLGGFLFLLAAWSAWLVLKTRYRAFPPVTPQAAPVARTVTIPDESRSEVRV